MPLRTRIAVLLGLLACALPSTGQAQSRVTIRIATQSPLSAEQAGRGNEIRLGAQLALERLGFRLELAVFDDQGRPDVAVANARNIVARRRSWPSSATWTGGSPLPPRRSTRRSRWR